VKLAKTFGVCVALVVLLLVGARLRAQRAAGDLSKLTVGALTREYLLHVPADLAKDTAVPLVFVFHGGNGQAFGTMNLTKLNDVADREKFLVVYPQGIGRSWNDGRITQVSQAHRDNVDDLAFFDALLAEISKTHRVDAKRIFATGISNGGIFSHYLAANRAEKVAAIAPVVGGIAVPFNEKFKPAHPVSVLIIQGANDPLVPYDGGKIAGGDGKERGSVIATTETIKMWVAANGCAPAAGPLLLPDKDPKDECHTEVTQWKGGRGGSEVWLYLVQGGGHTWPGGIQYLPQLLIGKVTHDFGSADIWEFFKTHPKA
jgi:polyhydroxybutyrate depolymerase